MYSCEFSSSTHTRINGSVKGCHVIFRSNWEKSRKVRQGDTLGGRKVYGGVVSECVESWLRLLGSVSLSEVELN
jgi:hypothetical protein